MFVVLVWAGCEVSVVRFESGVGGWVLCVWFFWMLCFFGGVLDGGVGE